MALKLFAKPSEVEAPNLEDGRVARLALQLRLMVPAGC